MSENASMFDLGQAGYPELVISRQALPFSDVDVGDTFKLIAEVKLDNIMPMGNAYHFKVVRVGFPGKQPDLGYAGNRVRDRREKGGF